MLKALYERLLRSRWEIGFVQNGLDGIFADRVHVEWVKNPFRDRWFADPFILDITDDYIYLLAEEYAFKTKRGRIAKLTISRESMVIVNYDIVLELSTHLSFPSILRENGKVFVYPESCATGRLDLYEYDSEIGRLSFMKTLLRESVWDSVITDLFGDRLLFASNYNDYHLDIYKWSEESSSFLHHLTVDSEKKDTRMAGQLFEYHGRIFCPSQCCEHNYGEAVIIKQVEMKESILSFSPVRRISRLHPFRKTALHTLNEYKGIVVIDAGGYDFPVIGRFLHRLVHLFHNS